MEPLLTVKDAAQYLQCSEAAVRKWIYQRKIPHVKVGRLTRLRRQDVEALAGASSSKRLDPAALAPA